MIPGIAAKNKNKKTMAEDTDQWTRLSTLEVIRQHNAEMKRESADQWKKIQHLYNYGDWIAV